MAATIIISVVVLGAMAAAIRYIVKSHREGKCVGCSGDCGGHCENCHPAHNK